MNKKVVNQWYLVLRNYPNQHSNDIYYLKMNYEGMYLIL